MNRLFHSAPIDLEAWIYITGVGLVAYLAVGFEKWVRLHFGAAKRVESAEETSG